MKRLLFLSLVLLFVSCNGLPPIHVCPDGTVTSGPCPSPSPAPSPTPTPSPSPTPTPSPSPGPTPTPSPTPTPVPSPTPSPSPSPCEPQPLPGPCFAPPDPNCTTCRDRLLWDLTHGDSAAKRARVAAATAKKAGKRPKALPSKPRGSVPKLLPKTNTCPPSCHLYELPGSGEKFRDQLLYNDTGAGRECFNWHCQKVDCRTRQVYVPQGWFGPVCEDPRPQVPCPFGPCPSPSPSPGPTPPPGDPVDCNTIFLCGVGAQVHAFQNAQHQTVPYHREGDGGFIYVPNGPVLGGKVSTDSTPYYKPRVDPPGGCGPRFSCNGEGEYWGPRCQHCERAPVWRQTKGPALDYHPYGEGYGVEAPLTQPGYYEFEACGQGAPCKTIAFRIEQ